MSSESGSSAKRPASADKEAAKRAKVDEGDKMDLDQGGQGSKDDQAGEDDQGGQDVQSGQSGQDDQVTHSESTLSNLSAQADASLVSAPGETSIDLDVKDDSNTQDRELEAWLKALGGYFATDALESLSRLYIAPDAKAWKIKAKQAVEALWRCIEEPSTSSPTHPPPEWLVRLLYERSEGADRQCVEARRRKFTTQLLDDWKEKIGAKETAKHGYHHHLRQAFDAESFFRVPFALPPFDNLVRSFYDDDYRGDAPTMLRNTLSEHEERLQADAVAAEADDDDGDVALSKSSKQPDESTKKKKPSAYGRSIVILQSSGTGKSRMVHELGKGDKFFVLMVCLRRDDPDGISGFPLADSQARDFLVSRMENDDELERRYACFYAAFFDKAHALLVTRASASARHAAWQSLSDLARSESGPGQAARRETYHEDSRPREHFLNGVLIEAKRIAEASPSPDKRGAITKAKEAAERLATVLPNDGYFVVAMDEASKLADARPGKGPLGTAPTTMRRFWQALARERFWLILVDTNQALTHVAPAIEASDRLARGELATLQPFLKLPLNVLLKPDEEVMSALELLSPLALAGLERITRFGRPLWHSLGIRRDDDMRFVATTIAGPQPDPGDAEATSSRAMGVLSQRLEVKYSASTSARSLVERQVHYHLRYLTGFSRSPDMLSTLSLGEPIPSIVASTILRCVDSDLPALEWKGAIKCLDEALRASDGPLDVGNCGELGAQALLCMAYDMASREDSSKAANLDATTSRWVGDTFVTLPSFLESLLGPSGASATGSNAAAMQRLLDSVLGRGFVRFTHFARAEKKLETLTPVDLLTAWAAGWAWLGFAGQEDWDMVIPVYCGALDQPMDLSKLTALPVQVKNRTRAKAYEAPQYLPKLEPTAPGAAVPPLCFVWLELGTSVGKAAKQGVSVSAKEDQESVTPRCDFIVTAMGCTEKTFPVLARTGTHRSLLSIMQRSQVDADPSPSPVRLYSAMVRGEAPRQ